VLFLLDALYRGQSGPLSPHQQRQLRILYSAAFGLSAVLNDLIDLARGERLVDATAVAFSLGECLYSVRDIVQPIAEEKGLTLELVGPDVDYRVGRPAALARVLLNLVTNALKFTDEGTVRVIARERGRERVEFEVSDTGRGMPPELADSLMEACRRCADARSHTLSTEGLGLSVCQKLIRDMDGELTVRTEPGAGTSISFQLNLPPAPRI